jgi:hypothetical protein
MNLTIEFSSEQVAALKAKASAQGLTVEQFLRKLAENEVQTVMTEKPFASGYGMLSKYGPAPSDDEINENRREMFQGFAKDF